jgi:hypothetical protein
MRCSDPGLRNEFFVRQGDRSIVDDAFKRWIQKHKGGRVDLNSRIPVVVTLPRERCVALHLKTPYLGGDPVYCYELRSDNFVESKEDVE